MKLQIEKFEDSEEQLSMIFDEDECAYVIYDACIIHYNGEDVGNYAEIEISKAGMLAIEVDFNAKEGICFYKKFHCTEHAVEFCRRNLSGNVRIGYLTLAIKWDQVVFWG